MDARDDRRSRAPRSASGMIFGSLILLAGAILLLHALGLLGPLRPWDFWPLLLVFAGVVNLLVPREAPQRVLGWLLILAGLVLLGKKLGLFDIRPSIIWAVLLIVFGGYVLWAAWRRRREQTGLDGDSPDLVAEVAVFGGCQTANRSQSFRGGEALAFFGGCDLDLTQAEIEGPQAVLYARALFGGIDIRVPEDWEVVVKGIGILGGYEDKTRHPRLDPEAAPKRLVVKGYAMFGGVDLKN